MCHALVPLAPTTHNVNNTPWCHAETCTKSESSSTTAPVSTLGSIPTHMWYCTMHTALGCSTSGCTLAPWTDWSQCSEPCGGGFQSRSSVSSQPALCESKTEVRMCSPKPCALDKGGVESCEYGPWEDWSLCSVKCGGGFQTRMRIVVFQAGGCFDTTEIQLCNIQPCILK